MLRHLEKKTISQLCVLWSYGGNKTVKSIYYRNSIIQSRESVITQTVFIFIFSPWNLWWRRAFYGQSGKKEVWPLPYNIWSSVELTPHGTTDIIAMWKLSVCDFLFLTQKLPISSYSSILAHILTIYAETCSFFSLSHPLSLCLCRYVVISKEIRANTHF